MQTRLDSLDMSVAGIPFEYGFAPLSAPDQTSDGSFSGKASWPQLQERLSAPLWLTLIDLPSFRPFEPSLYILHAGY